MESSNLNQRPDDPDSEAALEAWLRQPQPALPDDTFTRDVLQSLPPSRTPWSLRTLICAGASLAGLGVTWRGVSHAGGLDTVAASWRFQVQQVNDVLNPLLGPTGGWALLIGGATTAASLIYALGHRRGPAR